jgi:hypothetical protein
VSDGRRKPDGVQDRSTADDDDIAAAIEVRGVKDLQHPFENVNVILDDFAPRHDLNVSRRRNATSMPHDEGP